MTEEGFEREARTGEKISRSLLNSNGSQMKAVSAKSVHKSGEHVRKKGFERMERARGRTGSQSFTLIKFDF